MDVSSRITVEAQHTTESRRSRKEDQNVWRRLSLRTTMLSRTEAAAAASRPVKTYTYVHMIYIYINVCLEKKALTYATIILKFMMDLGTIGTLLPC